MPVVLVGVGIFALFSLFVAVGLSQLTRSQSGGFLGWLEKTLVTASGIGFVLADQVLKLTSWINHQLGKYYGEVESIGVRWIAGLSQYLKLMAGATVPWAFTLAQVMYWLVKSEIPRLVRSFPTRVEHIVKYVTKELPAIRKTIYKFPKLSKAQVQAALRALLPASLVADLALLRWLRSHFHELTATLPRAIPYPAGKTIAGIRARLKRLERITAGGLAVGVVVAALVKMGLSFIRCGNVKKTGKAICGMNPNLLESMLLDGVLIFSTLSVVEFAHSLRSIESEAVDILRLGIREFPKA